MNFDWLNPCPIYFLNSSPKKPKQTRAKQNKHQNWLSPFPSHQLLYLGDNNRERQALDDDRHEGCTICLLMSLCVSPHFCLPHPRFPFFLKSSLLVRCGGGSLQGNGTFLIKTLKLPKQVGSFSSFLAWVSCHLQVIFGFREILFTDRQTVCLWSQELQITAWAESAEPLFLSQVLVALHSHLAGAAALPKVYHLSLWCICPVSGPDASRRWAELNSHMQHLQSD